MPGLKRFFLSLLVALLLSCSMSHAQTTQPTPIRVSLLVYGAGADVYERFGHCGLRLRQEGRFDLICDWGVFDFTPDFLFKFARKDLRYWMEIYDHGDRVIHSYAKIDRTITEYDLDLTPEQARNLARDVQSMYESDRKFYDYDYFANNCSTILRDTLDRALDGQIRKATEGRMTPYSYRWHMRRLLPVGLANKIALMGADVSLGSPTDRPLNEWQTMFLPAEMGRSLESVQVMGSDGTLKPLVTGRRVLNVTRTPDHVEPVAPATAWPWWLAFGLAGAGAIVGLGRLKLRWPAGLMIVGWSLVATLWGLFMLYVMTLTKHDFARWNQNFLLFNPVSFGVIVGLLIRRWRPVAKWSAVIVLGLALVAVVLHVVPGIARQANLPELLAIVPIHAAVACRVWKRRSRSSRSV
ncbi:MAG: DUF4105 domain-containing protein [Tepidisphaeraceae bacterium]